MKELFFLKSYSCFNDYSCIYNRTSHEFRKKGVREKHDESFRLTI